jgi:YHS domain-containing protein
MAHCCQHCFCNCEGKISQVLKNGRRIYFCCEEHQKNWKKNRENYLAKEKNNHG